MIRQTLALLLDAYRDINSRKLFWISLILSGLVVAAFAMVGINNNGVTLLHFEFKSAFNAKLISPAEFYKYVFGLYGVGWWLNWIGIVLALVSTGGMFPDFLAGGSVDLYLSKPISRLRLFFTKYLAGLLFAGLQVAVFAATSFVFVGLRAGSWDLRILLAVPIALLVFSYVFAVCVLMGVMTRSTVAAIMLTLLIWFLGFGVRLADSTFTAFDTASGIERVAYARKLESLDRQIAQLRGRVAAGESAAQGSLDSVAQQRKETEDRRSATEPTRDNWATAVKVSRAVYTALPKTGETSDLLLRWLNIDTAEVEQEQMRRYEARSVARGLFNTFKDRTEVDPRDPEVIQKTAQTIRGRTTGWIIGTSLAFEAVMLTLAAWVFCRRDY